MTTLLELRDLQATCDNLKTIERDLANLPPDLAALDGQIKAATRRKADLEKALAEGRTQTEKLQKELALAQRLEAHARTAVKATTQKVQYTAAVRELDHREREVAAITRPLKELEARLVAQDTELVQVTAELETKTAQFEGLHQIFLAEHETQVAAKAALSAKRATLEAALEPALLKRFHQLLNQRQGRAVVGVENSVCLGCRTKLRIPAMTALREAKGIPTCESCQRIVFLA